MKDDGTYDALWILKKCVWCKQSIRPDDLSHTTDRETGMVYYEHKVCPSD
jgi:hypothetical protein